MKLVDAARFGVRLRRGNAPERRKIVAELLATHGREGMFDCIDLWFKTKRLNAAALCSLFLESTGVFVSIYEMRKQGERLPDVLSLESRPAGPTTWTTQKALAVLSDLRNYDMLNVAHELREDEANFFWRCALGWPRSCSKNSFLFALSRRRADVRVVHQAAAFMGVNELVTRILDDPASIPDAAKVNPKQAVVAAMYRPWGKRNLPLAEMYVDVVGGRRCLLHVYGNAHHRMSVLRKRSGERIRRLSADEIPDGEWIVEVEMDEDLRQVLMVTDCLYADSDISNLTYVKRIKKLEPWAERWNIIKPERVLRTDVEVGSLLESIPPASTLRLVKPGPYAFGEDGGWIAVSHIYRFACLVSGLTVIGDERKIELSLMDGFEPIVVSEFAPGVKILNQIDVVLKAREVVYQEGYNELTHYGIVMAITCTDIDEENMKFREITGPEIKVDDGIGDVSQITDMLEMME